MAKFYIQFYLADKSMTKPRAIEAFSDDCFEAARDAEETACGEKLPVDPKTDFPSFDVLDEYGTEIGAG